MIKNRIPAKNEKIKNIISIKELDNMDSEEYFALLERRFTSDRYSVQRKLQMAGQNLDFFAMRGRSGLVRYGKTAHFVLGKTIETASVNEIKSFSKSMTNYVLERWSKEHITGILCVPLIVSNSASQDVKDWLSKATMEKSMLAFEFPALFLLDESQIYYSKKTPLWGMVYYRGHRHFVESMLSA